MCALKDKRKKKRAGSFDEINQERVFFVALWVSFDF